MIRRIMGRLKRQLRSKGRLLSRFVAPWRERKLSPQEQTESVTFMVRLDFPELSKLAICQTYLSLLLQREKWILVLTGGESEKYPWYLRKSNHVLKAAMMPEGRVYIGHISAGTRLHPCALRCFRKALQAGNDVVYSDQFIRRRRRGESRVLLRPGYNPVLLRSQDYTGDVIIFNADQLTETEKQQWFNGRMSPYEAMLQLSGRTERFCRLPIFLYTAEERPEKDCIRCLRRYLAEKEPGTVVTAGADDVIFRVSYPLVRDSKVSIIIPNRDHMEDLRKCVESISARSTWKDYEILIVENGSTDPALMNYYDELKQAGKAEILCWTQPYNFAAICNEAAKQAAGRFLLFLNNDVEVITPDWMEAMIMHAQRPGTGAVGAKLLYPDGSVQHGGVILGVAGIAGHAFKHLDKDDMRNMGQLQSVRNCTAVTGACMMVEKERYIDAGGMDETLAVAYNDVDLCLRFQEAGLRNVYTPYATLYHYESKTRGAEDGAKKKRFEQETAIMQKRWREQLAQVDPYHHPHYGEYDEQYTLM